MLRSTPFLTEFAPLMVLKIYKWKTNLCFFFWKTNLSQAVEVDPSEPPRSTNWRKRDLESFAPVLVGSLVKWSTDSQAAARIIEVESMELGLHRLAVT